jgi:hypothetical protein
VKPLIGGPDAFRYLTLGAGKPVSRPFHLRWLLPYFCTTSHRAWWTVFLASWPIAAVGVGGWRVTVGDSWSAALAGAALLLALPGILGPRAVIPVGVDLPSTAVALLGVWVFELGHPTQVVAGVLIIGISAAIKESTPVFAALWLWSPLPLIALFVPVCRALLVKPGADPLGERFEHIAAHPVRAALDAHTGRWRDAWVMVAPWGVCLAALVGADWRLLVALGVAYAQLLVATDSVRLYQHAAGPVMAATAASVIPTQYLVLAVALHVVWWRKPERI